MSWIKNSRGKPDAMLTMAFIGFIVVMAKVLLGGSTINVGDWAIGLDPISPELAAVIMTPNIAGYVARKYTDRKFEQGGETTEDATETQS